MSINRKIKIIIIALIVFLLFSCSTKENNKVLLSESSDSITLIESNTDYIKDLEINRIGKVGLTPGLNEVVINGNIHLIVYVGEYSSTMVRIK